MTNHAAIAALAALAAAPLIFVHRDIWFFAVAAGLTGAIGAVLAIIDFRERRLPNKITFPLAVGSTIAVIALTFIHPETGSLGRSLITGVVTFALMLVLALVAGLGMGDVKYSYSIGLFLGWLGQPYISLGLLVAVLGAGLVAVVQAVRLRSFDGDLAFGPYLALGLWAALLSAGIAS